MVGEFVFFFNLIERKGYSPGEKLVGARHPSRPENAHLVLVEERPNSCQQSTPELRITHGESQRFFC